MFDITIPDQFSPAYKERFSDDKQNGVHLDRFNLVLPHTRGALARIYVGITDIIGDQPFHLVNHYPRLFMASIPAEEPVNESHLLALQDTIPYTVLENTWSDIDHLKDRDLEQLTKHLASKDITVEEFKRLAREATLHLDNGQKKDGYREFTEEEIQEKLNHLITPDHLPVHFSSYKLFYEEGLFNFKGLHFYVYSNHILENDAQRYMRYRDYTRQVEEEDDHAKQQKVMLEKSFKLELPEADLHFIKDPLDSWTTILCYYIQ